MAEGSSDYACVAVMDIPADKVDEYDQLVAASGADVFTRYRWRLTLSGENTAVFNTNGKPPGLQRRLLHVWTIPNFDSLQHVMAQAADNADYVKAQLLAIDELQNLHVKLLWDSPIGLDEKPINFYLVEVLHVVSGLEQRTALTNYMNRAVYDMSNVYGWTILFAGNQSTGLINEYVNIWGIGDTKNLEAAINKYRSEPAWSAAVSRVTTSLWTPRAMPAFVEPSTTTGGGAAGGEATTVTAPGTPAATG
jgi:hypothetical protein